MNGRKANKQEQKWITAILDYGCCVCKNGGIFSPAEVHHTEGGSKHLSAISLCPRHHRGGEDNSLYTSRHPFKARFKVRYGSDEELLAKLRDILEY